MGYKVKPVELELPEYQNEDDPADNLQVLAILPTVKEGATINAGRGTVTEKDGSERDETSEEYQRRVMALMVPKLRGWNLEEEDGTPVPVPRELHPGHDAAAREAQLEHLYAQDENIVLAIYQAWRLAGLPKKADSKEGKDSATQSMTGHDASPPSAEREWDVRELEIQIPMS